MEGPRVGTIAVIPILEYRRFIRVMVKIRLTRQGAKKSPFYRIIAIDERKPRNGRPLEYLGTVDPRTNPEQVNLRSEAIEAWVSKGAQLSPTVKSLIRRAKRHQAAAAGSAS